ncbi:hypothetical protein BDV96DRAFT_648770 [Lophiotrema nucula]|uniref:Uncharacterized protein n=1 Tax=Lophiotrema nucula TaxID=690887 RepID=A0A6A5Z0D7_9PLEO|nr:hypothetical protein BDV96DRAFT_648770 [Lophiotrema nucula]
MSSGQELTTSDDEVMSDRDTRRTASAWEGQHADFATAYAHLQYALDKSWNGILPRTTKSSMTLDDALTTTTNSLADNGITPSGDVEQLTTKEKGSWLKNRIALLGQKLKGSRQRSRKLYELLKAREQEIEGLREELEKRDAIIAKYEDRGRGGRSS